jgi:hypothetical protein
MVERIRSLLAQFPEDEVAARELIAKDASFDVLCQEYCKVVDLLDSFETEMAYAAPGFDRGYAAQASQGFAGRAIVKPY